MAIEGKRISELARVTKVVPADLLVVDRGGAEANSVYVEDVLSALQTEIDSYEIFVGTFNSVADMESYSGELSTRSYAYVKRLDGSVYVYDRYKYNGSEWVFQYTETHTEFTTEQWDAINSGITSLKLTQILERITNLETIIDGGNAFTE